MSLFPSIELSSVGSPLALWFSPSYCQWVYSMCLYGLPSRGFSTGLLYRRGHVFMAALQTALLFSKNYIIIRPWLDLTLNMEILYGSLISAENKNKTKKQNKKLQRINKQKATTKKHTLKLTNVTTTKNSAHHNYAHICRNPKKGLQTNQPINSCCV